MRIHLPPSDQSTSLPGVEPSKKRKREEERAEEVVKKSLPQEEQLAPPAKKRKREVEQLQPHGVAGDVAEVGTRVIQPVIHLGQPKEDVEMTPSEEEQAPVSRKRKLEEAPEARKKQKTELTPLPDIESNLALLKQTESNPELSVRILEAIFKAPEARTLSLEQKSELFSFIHEHGIHLEASTWNASIPMMTSDTPHSYVVKKALVTIPEEKRAAVIRDSLPLFDDATGAYDIAKYFKAVHNIPQDERPSIVQDTLRLFTSHMDQTEKLSLLAAMSAIPQNVRNTDETTPLQALFKSDNWDDVIIHEFVKNLSSRASIELHRIISRYNQISSLPKEQTGLTPYEMLKIAYFVEVDLPNTVDTTQLYFKKSLLDLPRSLAIDAETGAVFLLSKHNVDILRKEGTFKKVTSAVCLPLLQNAKTAHLVAQAVSKDTADQEEVEEGEKEMRIHKELSRDPGIWPIHTWFQYNKQLQSGESIAKISAISAIAESDLSKLRSLPHETLSLVAFSLIQGLHSMHQKWYVHGDLKLINALIRGVIVGLIDFGFTFKVGKDDPTFIYEKGYYGSIFCTPPEVFGVLDFSGDFFKTDVWALGLMLYELRFGSLPSWTEIPNKYYDEELDVTQAVQNKMKKEIRNDIEKRFAKLSNKDPLTEEESLDLLIYKMLRLDPNSRISMATALEEIKKIRP